jgi:hypothetical protein
MARRAVEWVEGVEGDRERLWRERLRRFKTCSGLAVAEFCAVEGVSPASFYQWRRRLAADRTRPAVERPVRSISRTAGSRRVNGMPASSQARFVPVRLNGPAAVGIEIHLPNGARLCLPGGDPEILRVAIESVGRLDRARPTEGPRC